LFFSLPIATLFGTGLVVCITA